MKAIAIVEIPDDAFDDDIWGDGQWMIDDEGAIRYKEDDAWMHYKDIDVDGIELRPLPQKKTEEGEKRKYPFNDDLFWDLYIQGWNECLDEITGETE